MEISGAMSAQEHGHEPELLISSDATALGVALHGPAQLAFAAGASLRLGPTDEMPSLCSEITADTLTQVPSPVAYGSAPPDDDARADANVRPETLSPTEETFPGVCAGGDEESIMMDPRLEPAHLQTLERGCRGKFQPFTSSLKSRAPFRPRRGCRRARATDRILRYGLSAWCCMVRRSCRSRPARAYTWARRIRCPSCARATRAV